LGTQVFKLQHVPSLAITNGSATNSDPPGVNGHSIPPLDDDLEPSAADNLKSLVQECGVSSHKISELLQELPPQRVSDVLVDYYFTSMCVVRWCTHSGASSWLPYPETGLVIPYQKRIFALATLRFVPTAVTELEQPTLMTFVSYPSSLLYWRSQLAFLLNISVAMPVRGGSHHCVTIGLVSTFSLSFLIH